MRIARSRNCSASAMRSGSWKASCLESCTSSRATCFSRSRKRVTLDSKPRSNPSTPSAGATSVSARSQRPGAIPRFASPYGDRFGDAGLPLVDVLNDRTLNPAQEVLELVDLFRDGSARARTLIGEVAEHRT